MQNAPIELTAETHRQPLPAPPQADPNNEFIRAVAIRLTDSLEEAEAAVMEMQKDIDNCATGRVAVEPAEARIRAAIVWRRLIALVR